MPEIEAEIPNFTCADPLMRMERIKNGYVFSIGEGNSGQDFRIENNIIYCGDYPRGCGVLCSIENLSQKTKDKLKGAVRLVVCAADGSDNAIVDVSTDAASRVPSLSFDCLDRLMSKSSDAKVLAKRSMTALAKGGVSVLDFLPDEQRPLSFVERKLKDKSSKKLKPPAPGFSLVGTAGTGQQWHRSATVLLKDLKTQKHFLLGTDDSQYFGVELKGKPKTIDEAFEDLIPEEARRCPARRQGEWFAVPVEEKDLPVPCGEIDTLILPKDNRDSNNHHLSATEIRVGSGGVVYARDPALEHSEHGSIEVKGWHKFLRNTAIRSVSEQGVD